MNETIDHIRTRRSVRSGFTTKRLSPEIMEEIIRCGLSAPSSKNSQPWKFHVVTSRPLLDQIATAVELAKGINEYVPHDPSTGRPRPEYSSTVIKSANVLRHVPAAVFIENEGPFSNCQKTATTLEGYGFEMTSIGAAIAFMLLAAKSLNVASVFMGDVCVARKTIKDTLGIHHDLCGVLALGYSAEPQPPRQEVKGHEKRTHVVWHG